jgi:hypothetical protein
MLPHTQRLHKNKIDPVSYMLPLATIVGLGHHSTIEVALPLNLNLKDRFKYIIGIYNSLKPVGLGMYFEGIHNALGKATKKAVENLILIYYKKGQKEVEGYVKIEFDETRIWEEIATLDGKLLTLFKYFSPFPTKWDIAKLHPELRKNFFTQA